MERRQKGFFRFLDRTTTEGLRGHVRTLRNCYPLALGYSRGEQLLVRIEMIESEIKERQLMRYKDNQLQEIMPIWIESHHQPR